MGDKDTDKLFGNSELLICGEDGELKSLGTIVDGRVSLKSEETETVLLGNSSIGFDVPKDMVSTFCGIDLAAEPSKERCSLIIEFEPEVIKPKHLKYPNKRRKLRVLKKWKRRFGMTPAKALCLPDVDMECALGEYRLNIKAKPV